MKIYLIRHGECDSNVKYIYNYKDEDINHNGIARAFYAYFNGVPEDGMLWNLGMKNTDIREYEL